MKRHFLKKQLYLEKIKVLFFQFLLMKIKAGNGAPPVVQKQTSNDSWGDITCKIKKSNTVASFLQLI
jgi:hypothetical protein